MHEGAPCCNSRRWSPRLHTGAHSLANVYAQVLILLPFRNAALGVVLRLAALAQAETRTDSVQHKERFLREFGDEDGEPPHVRLSTLPLRLVSKMGPQLPPAGQLLGAPSSAAAKKADADL